MQALPTQIRFAYQNGLYFLALVGALSIPDMCAGLASPNGRTTGSLYQAWFDQWVAPAYAGNMSGSDCYGLRCSLLHQGLAHPHQGLYQRVIFVEPGPIGVFHNNVINNALNLDIPTFCEDMIAGADNWWATAQGSQTVQSNMHRFFSRHANGIPPFIVGVPVYG